MISLEQWSSLEHMKGTMALERGEERFREEGETAKKDREEGERKRKK